MLGSADCCLSFRFVVAPRVLRSVLHGPDCSQAKQIVGGRDQRKVHDLRQWRQGTDLREKPDVSIEEQLQSRSASISFSSMTGDTMSPMMSIVSFMEPIRLFCPAHDFSDGLAEAHDPSGFFAGAPVRAAQGTWLEFRGYWQDACRLSERSLNSLQLMLRIATSGRGLAAQMSCRSQSSFTQQRNHISLSPSREV